MKTSRRSSMLQAALLVGITVFVAGQAYAAPTYPGNKCVSAKQKEAGKYCKRVLKAWGKWEKSQDDAARDAKLADALTKMSDKWTKAETKSSSKGVDCADTTGTAGDVAAIIDAAVGDIVTAVNDGLDLGNSGDQTCGQKLLKAAGKKCDKFLKAESKLMKKLEKDPDGANRDAAQDKASTKFSSDWSKATAGGCSTTATEGGIEALVDGINDVVVTNTTVSPNVDDTQFTTISPVGPIEYQGREFSPTCIFDTPYHFFVKRGSVNKLVMYYQGGGACWENLTCTFETCDTNVNPAGGDNPNGATTGFADLTNPDNPFKDWNIVFVSYCSCDIHFGEASQTYSGAFPDIDVEHQGYANTRVAEKWAREHFVNPEVVFVTGSSAGAYGALFNGPLHHEVWPASDFHVLADAGNGVITPEFLQNEFGNWNFTANLPPEIPGVLETITEGTGMVGYIGAVADYFPNTTWAHYSTAYDGGSGGQTGFYNVMLNGNDPLAALTWWEGSCAFNGVMKQQALDTAAANPDNYRYYIGSGSRHTMYGSDKVYDDTTGGVPTIVDWVNGMLASSPPGTQDAAWTNVEASNFGLLLKGVCSSGSTNPGADCNFNSDCPGGTCLGEDVKPSPLVCPFETDGTDVTINCVDCSSPSGAFLDTESGLLD
jgi:hypothetical protein